MNLPRCRQHAGDAMSDVIEFSKLRADQAQGNSNARFPAIAQVEAYWQALRCDNLLPRRADLDPRGISDALEFTFMLDHVAPGVGRIRIAGMHLNDVMGMDTRGMPITALLEAAGRPALTEALKTICARDKTASLDLKGKAGFGRPELNGRMWLAPLRVENGQRQIILGCLQSTGSLGRAPRRFTVTHSATKPIDAARDRELARQAELGFAEVAQVFQQKGPGESRPALRVVPSD